MWIDDPWWYLPEIPPIYYRRFGSRPVLTYPASTYLESCSNSLRWLLRTVWPSILHPWSSWHILSGSGSPRTRNQKEVPESRTGECIRAKTTSLLPMDPSHPRPGVEWQRTELSLSMNFLWLNISDWIPLNQSYYILEFSQAVATCSIQYNKPCFYNSFSVAFLLYSYFYCFEYGNALSCREQGKKLQHFILDKVAKFTSFVSWTGSGFCWVGRTTLPKFLLSTSGKIPGRQRRATTGPNTTSPWSTCHALMNWSDSKQDILELVELVAERWILVERNKSWRVEFDSSSDSLKWRWSWHEENRAYVLVPGNEVGGVTRESDGGAPARPFDYIVIWKTWYVIP